MSLVRFWATIVLALCLGIWPRLGMGEEKDEPALPKDLTELEQALQKILDESKTAGAGVALVSRDEVLWLGGIGRADLATGRRVTPDTLFRVGSLRRRENRRKTLRRLRSGEPVRSDRNEDRELLSDGGGREESGQGLRKRRRDRSTLLAHCGPTLGGHQRLRTGDGVFCPAVVEPRCDRRATTSPAGVH